LFGCLLLAVFFRSFILSHNTFEFKLSYGWLTGAGILLCRQFMSRATARPQRQGAAMSLRSRIRIPIRRIRLAVAILSIAPMWILPPNTWAVAR